jgi:Flp pilus assembly protein TadD
MRGHYLRGLLLQQLGRLAEAEAELAHAAELDPEAAAVFRALAEVRARRQDFAGAAVAYARMITLQPDNAEAHAGLGYMLALTGRNDEAAQQWAEALRLDPGFPGLRERLDKLRR